MKEREKRIKSMEQELLDIYSHLFGTDYANEDELAKDSQFHAIVEKFKEKHFFVREMQKDRERREKKGMSKVVDEIQNNERIREELKKCEIILKQAAERIATDLKKDERDRSQKIRRKRQTILGQCLQMLTNANEVEFGQSYAPKKQRPTLEQFKKKNNADPQDEIDLQEEQALERFRRKDNQIEGIITQIRNVDKEVKYELRNANQAIGITKEMIEKNLVKAERVEKKIKKGTNDLRQVLTQYRKPSKLCLDVILVLLILALIGVIINMVRSSKI